MSGLSDIAHMAPGYHPADKLRKLFSQRLIDLHVATPRAPNSARQDIACAEELIEEIRAEAWQDGHDTALLHGQSENPYEQETP